ncbi:MAG: hypothetical protein IT271_01695 [Chitinophagales bacterium]|nr:hypothetical protein [Chitinophagales bacterium]
MVELIQQLLLTGNCVIIPNFGAFIGNYHPAEIRLQFNTIVPPTKLIAFNRSLQNNDGLLINTVAHHFLVSYHEAELQVADFVKQWNVALSQHKSLILKDIGRFVVDAENNIQFQPYYTKNYLLESFGLQSMPIQPIQRLKDSESSIKENYQRILHPELMEDAVTPKRTSNKVSYWITAVLAVLFLGASLILNIQKTGTYQNQSSLLPAFDKAVDPATTPVSENKTSIAAAEPTTVKTEETVITPAVALPTKPSKNKTYIVIGAFFDEVRAIKLKSEAESKGYVVNISKDNSNGLFRTTVQVENSEVKTALQKVKSEINSRAWVYCMKCKLY